MNLTEVGTGASGAGNKEWLEASKDMVISAYDSAPMLLGKAELFLRGDLLNVVQNNNPSLSNTPMAEGGGRLV